jgi:hypothetical protein
MKKQRAETRKTTEKIKIEWGHRAAPRAHSRGPRWLRAGVGVSSYQRARLPKVNAPPVVVPPTFDDITTLSWALAALRGANERHLTARHRFDDDDATARPAAYASMAEATWWIAALDERLWCHHGAGYQAARDAHEFGGAVRGILWARDRHSHQLGKTAGRDDRGLYDPEPGGVLHLSRGFVWQPAQGIAAAAKGKDGRRPDYEQFVAGRSSLEPLARAAEWFTDFAKVRGTVLIDPVDLLM